MDSEHLSRLVDRYFRGETSLEEEATLRRILSQRDGQQDDADAFRTTPEARAAAARLALAEHANDGKAPLRLHHRTANPWRMAIATVTAAAAVIVAVVTLTRPTVYGYVNGRPVTSLAEARDCSERMFSDMRTDDGDRTAPLRDILDIE